MYRFLIPSAQPDPQGRIDLRPIARQIGRVLRLARGDTVMVLDGTGRAYTVRLAQLDEGATWGEAIGETWLPEPALHLSLYQCALKHDKFEWVLQKGTELGISAFVPVVSTRTVVRPVAALEKKRVRWETILREATEQCGRGVVPILAPAQAWDAAVRAPVQTPPNTHTDSPPLKLVAWEAGVDPGAPDRQTPIPSLAQVVAAWRTHTKPSAAQRPHVALCIGPEGGLDAEEVVLAHSNGWQIVHLGPRILRAETAALAAAAMTLHIFDEFGQAAAA